MLSLTAVDRRARLQRRHLLAGDQASTVLDIGEAVLALHATDPATVYLSVLARCPTATLADVATALYTDRALVRMLAMRRTLFVVPMDIAPVVHAAASLDVAATARQRIVKMLTTLPTDPPLEGDVEEWLEAVAAATEKALVARGSATASQLASDEPRLRTAILPTTDKKYDVRRAITSQVMTLLGAEGRIVRGEHRGSWTSRAPVWEPASRWWPDGIPVVEASEARRLLAERWLRTFGPATVADLQWWTGWSLGVTRRALAGLDVVDVDLDGAPGLVLADDVDEVLASDVDEVLAGDVGEVPAVEPAAVLLPSLDPAPMGYKHRDWFFAVDRGPLFDAYGNIGPTVWWDGEIVGGWAVRPDGSIAWRLLTDRGRAAVAAVEVAVARLESRLGGSAVVPSFATPLERELRTT